MKGRCYISLSLLYYLVSLVQTRNIDTSPAPDIKSSSQQAFTIEHDDISTNAEFLGLMTFANVPFLNCLRENNNVAAYDIAFLGAPFDTVSPLFAVIRHMLANHHIF